MTIIYAFTYRPEYEGLLKVGETVRSVNERIKDSIQMPSEPIIELSIECGDISDHDVHRELIKMGKRNVNGEWFECVKEDVIQAILNVKGIQVKDEGNYVSEELVKYIDENKQNLESKAELNEITDILVSCKAMGIKDVLDLKSIFDIWSKVKENNNIKVLEAISKYGIEKLIKNYDITFSKIERVSNFNIQEVLQNKAIINSFLRLHDIYGKDTTVILNYFSTLYNLLEEDKVNPVFTRALFKNLKNICEEAERMKISERECLERIEKNIETVNMMMKEMNCHSLRGLEALIRMYEDYRTNKEQIDTYIKRIQEVWKEWGVKDINEFWEVAKKVDKEQKNYKNNLIKVIIGKEYDQNTVKSLEKEIFSFGKYKGKKIKQVIYEDKQYINWLIDSCIERIQILTILSEQVKKEKSNKKGDEQRQLPEKSMKDIREALGFK